MLSLLGIKFPVGPQHHRWRQRGADAEGTAGARAVPRRLDVVEGHTDANGSDSANLILSQDRADAVKQYLVTNFAPTGEVSSVGYGEARPVATNETPAGRARNRRIDLIIHPCRRSADAQPLRQLVRVLMRGPMQAVACSAQRSQFTQPESPLT